MITIAPAENRRMPRALQVGAIAMTIARWARSSKEAEEGKLLIMAGGSRPISSDAEPLFSLLADSIKHCGTSQQRHPYRKWSTITSLTDQTS